MNNDAKHAETVQAADKLSRVWELSAKVRKFRGVVRVMVDGAIIVVG